MTGSSRAARAIAYPIRWVYEIFLPAAASCAFSSRRRASSTSTVISRNEVAVGTERESVMFCARRAAGRSEEHTSELQSHSDLVCRLLLEKKKKIKSHKRVL